MHRTTANHRLPQRAAAPFTLLAAALSFILGSCSPPAAEAPLEPSAQHLAALAAAPGWTPAGSMIESRYSHTATLLPNGKVLVAAGASGNTSPVYLASAELYDPATGTWAATGSLAQARFGHTATLLPDGKVLVTGGIGPSSPPFNASAEVYDPATGTWTATGSLAQARYGHTATLLSTGKVLVVGGYGNSGPLASAELYDPATGTWTAAAPVAHARSWHTATLLPTGKVLIVGGWNNSGILASAELYDPAAGTWTTTGALTQARSGHSATSLLDGKVLVVGCSCSLADVPTYGEVYDPATGTWTATRPLTQVRSGHAATLLPDGKVLIAGGENSSVEVYDPATGSWTPLRPLLWHRYVITATLLADGRVLVAGRSSDSVIRPDAELYDAATIGDWAGTRSLDQARVDPTATLLPQGKVLVAGGDFNGIPVAQTELYDPATGTWTGATPLNQARSRHTALLLPQGKVLVAGGHADTHSLAHAELYDPATGAWAPTSPMTQARERHTATLLPGGKVLIAGGLSDTSSLTSAELYDPATGTWALTGPMTQARSRHTATLLPDGKVLVAGGLDGTGALSSAEVYDPVSGTWAPVGSLAQAGADHTATLLPEGKVLIAGGDFNGAPLTRAELYDPATGTWSSTGSLALARGNHTATLLQDGRVLITGGGSASSSLASAEVYTPATGAWAPVRAPTQARARHTATLLPDGKVLVAGGDFNNTPLDSAELYDPVIGSWNLTGSLAQARGKHTATLLPDGKVLVTGGGSVHDSTTFNSAERYDPATGTWTATSPMAQARARHTATLLPDGRVLVGGGYGSSRYQSTAEVYNPVTGTWASTGTMSQARAGHTATLLRSGRVLIVGGTDSSYESLASAEVYDPATGTWAPTGSMALGRDHHTATLLPDGKVLVVGGGSTLGEVYDPATGTWTATRPMSQSRYSHTATLLPNGKVLVAGGHANSALASVEVYDPATGTWASTGALNQPRYRHTATLLADGKVLIASAENSFVNVHSSSTEVYDPATGTWALMRPLTRARELHTVTLMSDGRVLAVGGDFQPVATAEVYQQQEGDPTWRPAISGISPSATLEPGSVFTLNGSRLRGMSEASSGTTSSSPSDVPLLTLRDLERGQLLALSFQDFSSTHVTASVPQVPPGQYLLSVTVNGQTSSTVLAIIAGPDTTPPSTVTLTAPVAGATLWGTVTLAATASDDVAVTRVEFYDGSTLLGADLAPPFSLDWNTKTAANGPHLLTVKAFDAAGQSATSAGVSVTLSNDLTPPTVTISSPEVGATVTGTIVAIASATDDRGVTRVDFHEGTRRLCTPLYSPSGWYTCNWDTGAGPNGARTLTVKAYDSEGNVGVATVTVTVDNNVPPTVALTALPEGATLTGTVTFSATATHPVGISRVDFFVGSTQVGTDSTWPYSIDYDTRSLPNGAQTITARAYSTTNNVGTSAPVNVLFDNDLTPPTVALTAPVAGATLWGTVALSANASDNITVTRVEFYDGTTLLETVYSAPYSYSWDSRTAANGAHVLTAKAYDAVGQSTTSAGVSVTLNNDLVVPTVAFTAPAEGATVLGTLTLTATATDNVAVTRVEFYDGSTRLSTDTASPYTYSWNTLTSPNGEHTLTARAYDATGNIGIAEVTVTVNNDFTPPTVELTSPTEGATVSGTLVLSATASDNKAVTRVAFFVGSTQVGSDTTAPYSYSYNTRLQANGAKVLTARAYDAANNVATSASVNVTFDNDFTLPTVMLTSPTEGETLSGTVTFAATASDASGIARVAFFVGSTQVGSDTTAPYSYSYNTRLQANGAKVLTARAYDTLNNVSASASVNVTFDNDFTLPTVTLTSPTAGATLTGTVTFTATASDASGISKVVFFVGTTQVCTALAEPYSCTYNTRALSNGAKALTAKAYDTLNNVATSAAVNVTVDNDFTAPTTALTSPTGGSTVSGVVQLTAIASDDRGTVTKVDFYQGSLLLGTATTAPYSWTWDTTKASIGTHSLRTRAWDAAGNSAYSPNVTVTVTR
jgi:uncharacterized delta-60 repeat protein